MDTTQSDYTRTTRFERIHKTDNLLKWHAQVRVAQFRPSSLFRVGFSFALASIRHEIENVL